MTKIPPNRGQMVGKAETDEQLNAKLFTFALPLPSGSPLQGKKNQAPNPKPMLSL